MRVNANGWADCRGRGGRRGETLRRRRWGRRRGWWRWTDILDDEGVGGVLRWRSGGLVPPANPD